MYKCNNCNQVFTDNDIIDSFGECPICGNVNLVRISNHPRSVILNKIKKVFKSVRKKSI